MTGFYEAYAEGYRDGYRGVDNSWDAGARKEDYMRGWDEGFQRGQEDTKDECYNQDF